jgi:uncharacterized membrane protein YgdD (TMEM256/DUF423 family)
MSPRIILIVCTLVCFSGCATRPKTYHAPDNRKLKAAEDALNKKAALAQETAKKARAATLKAQANGKQLIALSKAVKDKLAFLMGKVPPALVPLVKDIQDAAKAQEDQEQILRQSIDEAVAWNVQLAAQQVDVEAARLNTVVEADKYEAGAAQTALDATDERNSRITAEKALSLSRWYGWLWKIGIFLFIGLVVFLIIAKVLGKLTLWGAKTAAKIEGV